MVHEKNIQLPPASHNQQVYYPIDPALRHNHLNNVLQFEIGVAHDMNGPVATGEKEQISFVVPRQLVNL